MFKTLTILLMFLMLSGTVQATSLWGEGLDLYGDQRASQAGDLVTVLIMEQNKATQQADTSTSQQLGISLDPGVFLSDLFGGLSPEYEDQAGAMGTTSRSGTVVGQITVEVVEVLPNGNFRVEGVKGILVNGELEEIFLQGVIRPADICGDNTVESNRVADVSLEYKGRGVIAAKQRPSFLEWILNWIF